jgi:ArsR family transcriptional regulator
VLGENYGGEITLTKEKILKHEHDYYYEMSNFFSIFADCTRLKILHALLDGDKCVKKICDVVGINQSACSHQLKILRQYKVVKPKRSGRFVRYSIDNEYIKEIIKIGESRIER